MVPAQPLLLRPRRSSTSNSCTTIIKSALPKPNNSKCINSQTIRIVETRAVFAHLVLVNANSQWCQVRKLVQSAGKSEALQVILVPWRRMCSAICTICKTHQLKRRMSLRKTSSVGRFQQRTSRLSSKRVAISCYRAPSTTLIRLKRKVRKQRCSSVLMVAAWADSRWSARSLAAPPPTPPITTTRLAWRARRQAIRYKVETSRGGSCTRPQKIPIKVMCWQVTMYSCMKTDWLTLWTEDSSRAYKASSIRAYLSTTTFLPSSQQPMVEQGPHSSSILTICKVTWRLSSSKAFRHQADSNKWL